MDKGNPMRKKYNRSTKYLRKENFSKQKLGNENKKNQFKFPPLGNKKKSYWQSERLLHHSKYRFFPLQIFIFINKLIDKAEQSISFGEIYGAQT